MTTLTKTRASELATIAYNSIQAAEALEARIRNDRLKLTAHVIAAGEALVEAKQLVPHGKWTKWLKQHVHVSEGHARRYCRIAQNADLIRTLAPEGITSLRHADALIRKRRSPSSPDLAIEHSDAGTSFSREGFIYLLEGLQHGSGAASDEIPSAPYVCFVDGHAITFNGDAFVRAPCGLGFDELALRRSRLVDVIKGISGRRLVIIDADDLLYPPIGPQFCSVTNQIATVESEDIPYDASQHDEHQLGRLPTPTSWTPIIGSFIEGLEKLLPFAMPHSMVTLQQDRLELFDESQHLTFSAPTGFDEAICVRAELLKPISTLNVDEVSTEADDFVGFRNASLTYGIRKCDLINPERAANPQEGKPIMFGDDALSAAESASKSLRQRRLTIDIAANHLQFIATGEGVHRYEPASLTYDGPAILGHVHPQILTAVLRTTRSGTIEAIEADTPTGAAYGIFTARDGKLWMMIEFSPDPEHP